MAEKLRNSERLNDSVELENNHEQSRERIAEQLKEKAERESRESDSKAEKEAEREALEKAKSIEEESNDNDSEKAPAPEKPVKQITKRDLDIKFNKTMSHIQKDMKPASRAFSKFIHNPVVDKTSEAIGRTIARPNLVLAGGIGTLTLGLLVYLVAKNYGYVLSGFEVMASFILGWATGAIVEFIRVGFKNKRSI